MSEFLQDVRYALRGLRRSPGFTLTAVLTLALGIGANTAIFSVVHAVLLREPAGVADFDRLVAIYTSDFSGPAFGTSSFLDLQDYAAGAPAIAAVAAHIPRPMVISDPEGGRPAERVMGQLVSANYFEVLGVSMALGRAFSAADATAESPIVLGDGFWRARYGADPGIVGRTIRLSGVPLTVVGVAPAGFGGMMPALAPSFYVPIEVAAAMGQMDPTARGSRGLFAFGRLADGASLEQAQAQLEAVAAGLFVQYPDAWTDVSDRSRRVTVIPAAEATLPVQLRGPAKAFAAVLMGVVAAVLLICCANITNLLLVRATARQREMGIRLALGAGRARVLRQLVTESLVLAGLGALAGIALAFAGTRLLAGAQLPSPIPIQLDVAPDPTVLGFALVVTLVAAVLFGIAPAMSGAHGSLTSAIREAAPAGVVGRRLGLRGLLAGGQIAVAVLLLVMGGLLVRSLLSAQAMDPGFRTADVLFVSLAQGAIGTTPEQALAMNRTLRDRLAALPGVRSTAYVGTLPLGAGAGRRGYSVEGYTPGETEEMEFNTADAGPGYFEAMGTAVVRGREFTDRDGPDAPRVAIVNEAFALRYLGGDAIGKRLSPGRPTEAEIVGVVRDGKYRSLGEEPLPFVYRALDQNGSGTVTLVLHAPGALTGLDTAVRAILAESAPDAAIVSVTTAEQHLAYALLPQRAGAWLLGLFGLLGLALAALGVYGVMAYAVSQRTREIGIRLAIGARQSDIVRMVVRQGATVAAAGAVIGLALAAGASRLLGFLLFQVDPLDPLTFAATTAIVAAVTLLANWIPARRSAGVSAVIAMKGD